MRGRAGGEVRADGQNNQRVNKVFGYGWMDCSPSHTPHIATHTRRQPDNFGINLFFINLLYSIDRQRRLEGYCRGRGMLSDHCSHEICNSKSSGIYPQRQAKAIKLSKSDFISQSCFFYSQAKTTLTPVLMMH